ncbi:hypothetical protein WJX72_007542 [[Myrmecia] bisecta]|uniref:Uncharacterized protein n=1 Tax=[Myrmecia] bisecta TaxID=41462 RepID=A0AAW1R7E7_9CHLO
MAPITGFALQGQLQILPATAQLSTAQQRNTQLAGSRGSLQCKQFLSCRSTRQQAHLKLQRRESTTVQAVAAADQQIAKSTSTKDTWYAVVSNAEFMFNDVQNESFAEQLRERRRYFGEQNREPDFYLVPNPAWLDDKFPDKAKQVRRPSAALVSTDKVWITFMKLRLDRVLKLELGELSLEEVTKSTGPLPEFKKPDKWTAPYPPYKPGWWEVFMAGQ